MVSFNFCFITKKAHLPYYLRTAHLLKWSSRKSAGQLAVCVSSSHVFWWMKYSPRALLCSISTQWRTVGLSFTTERNHACSTSCCASYGNVLQWRKKTKRKQIKKRKNNEKEVYSRTTFLPWRMTWLCPKRRTCYSSALRVLRCAVKHKLFTLNDYNNSTISCR